MTGERRRQQVALRAEFLGAKVRGDGSAPAQVEQVKLARCRAAGWRAMAGSGDQEEERATA